MTALATWLPPIAWTGLVLALSSPSFSADNTGGILRPLLAWLLPWLSASSIEVLHWLLRKAAHVTEYAVLAALWFRAFTRSGTVRPPAAAWLALVVGVVVATVDELRQSALASRGGSAGDVLLDTTGVVLAIVPARLGWRRAVDRATGVLLWVGAVGGLLALGLTLAAGAGGGVLWVTVPLAALALVYRRRRVRTAAR